MTALDEAAPAELGPVDYALIEFPAGHRAFTGQLADELLRLVDSETVDILDLFVITKDLDGTVKAVEIEDSDERADIRALRAHVAEILAADDVVALAAALQPGSIAGVVVWENTWAAPFVTAVLATGGQLVAGGRISLSAILASIEDDLYDTGDPEGG